MTNFIRATLSVAIIFMFTACQKHDNTPADLTKVAVTWNQPLNGASFHKGDTVDIDANIKYTSEIKGVMIQIIDSAANMVVYEEDKDLHTDEFNFQEKWVDTFSNATTLKVIVKVAVANASELAERNFYFQTQP